MPRTLLNDTGQSASIAALTQKREAQKSMLTELIGKQFHALHLGKMALTANLYEPDEQDQNNYLQANAEILHSTAKSLALGGMDAGKNQLPIINKLVGLDRPVDDLTPDDLTPYAALKRVLNQKIGEGVAHQSSKERVLKTVTYLSSMRKSQGAPLNEEYFTFLSDELNKLVPTKALDAHRTMSQGQRHYGSARGKPFDYATAKLFDEQFHKLIEKQVPDLIDSYKDINRDAFNRTNFGYTTGSELRAASGRSFERSNRLLNKLNQFESEEPTTSTDKCLGEQLKYLDNSYYHAFTNPQKFEEFHPKRIGNFIQNFESEASQASEEPSTTGQKRDPAEASLDDHSQPTQRTRPNDRVIVPNSNNSSDLDDRPSRENRSSGYEI